MPSTRIKKGKSKVVLEVCWWGQTRIILEEVFRKPRLMGTFPFNTGYDVLIWPSAVVAVLTVIFNFLGVIYSMNIVLNVNIFNIPLARFVKGVLTTTCNISSPIWMTRNHKCVIILLRSVASVEKELDKVSVKWDQKHKDIPFFLFHVIIVLITIFQGVWLYLRINILSAISLVAVVICVCPNLSYIWQYLTLHNALRSLMNRISEIDDVDSFVYCYHALVLAYRAVDELYGLQIIIYFLMAMQAIVHSLHFTFSDNIFDGFFICQILWTWFYTVIVFLMVKRCNSSVTEVGYFIFNEVCNTYNCKNYAIIYYTCFLFIYFN